MDRLTALQITEYQNFGGGFFDSTAHANMYRTNEVHHFGVTTSRLFASVDNLGMTNKRWNYMTLAQGNYYKTPGGKDTYSWDVAGDGDREVRITKKYVAASTQCGKDGGTFLVGVDVPWYNEPGLFKTEDDSAPLVEIIGYPQGDGPNNFILELKLQDGNTNSWISDTMFDEGKTLTVGGSRVSTELNTKYRNIGPWSSPIRLQSVVGQVSAKVKFTDRFIRTELACAKSGSNNNTSYKDLSGKSYNDAFSRGHIYYTNAKDKSNREVKKGYFISAAEERLLEAVEFDINYMAEWGRLEISADRDSDYTVKTAAGWRQLYKDGQYMPHNGTFTLTWLYEKIHQILHNKRRFKNRKPVLVGGIGAISYIAQLIADYAPLSTITEPGFGVHRNTTPTGVHQNEYAYGFMFTKFLAPNGVEIQVMYDPTKDDSTQFKTKAPGSFLPLESFQIDILDFGETEDAAENSNGKNITMIVQDNADYYFSIANAVQKAGHVNDGSNVYNFGKELSLFREKSGSLGIWDTFAIGRIEWVLS